MFLLVLEAPRPFLSYGCPLDSQLLQNLVQRQHGPSRELRLHPRAPKLILHLTRFLGDGSVCTLGSVGPDVWMSATARNFVSRLEPRNNQLISEELAPCNWRERATSSCRVVHHLHPTATTSRVKLQRRQTGVFVVCFVLQGTGVTSGNVFAGNAPVMFVFTCG